MPTLVTPKNTVVLDNGSGMLRVGFAGEKKPRALLPAKSSAKYPVKRGVITDWEGMLTLWKKVFQETLRVDPRECSVFLIEAPTASKEQREKTTHAFLELFKVPRFYLAKDAAMTAHALDRKTAIVLDMGDGVSHVSPIKAGKVQSKAVRRLELAGRDLDSPEPLFKPNLLGLEQDGIHKLAVQSIMACDVDIRKELFGNIILAGGSTLLKGVAERLQKEIKALAPDSMTLTIIAPPEGQHTAWAGASGLASLSTFEEMWITKDEYDESGPGIVHRKCT